MPGIKTRIRLYKTLIIMVLGTLLSGCFDPKEGCLDPAAVNYFAGADQNCCCRYPQLILTTDQVYDTLNFQKDAIYPDGQGHYFRIKSIVFYLSEFQLYKDVQAFSPGDSAVFKVYGAGQSDTLEQTFTDDFVLIKRTPVDNPVASFREIGNFDGISFRLGVSEQAGHIIPALAPAGHPLQPQAENLYLNNDYVFLQAVVVPDTVSTTLPDTLNFTRSDLGDYFLTDSGSFYHEPAFNFQLTLHADWARLFAGVNWTNRDIPAWKTRIISNLPGTFTVTQ